MLLPPLEGRGSEALPPVVGLWKEALGRPAKGCWWPFGSPATVWISARASACVRARVQECVYANIRMCECNRSEFFRALKIVCAFALASEQKMLCSLVRSLVAA
jgi:hypothetical protein